MIDLSDIVQGIIDKLATVDKELEITDDSFENIIGDSIVVKVIDNLIDKHSPNIYKRQISGDIVYLATIDKKAHEIQSFGQKLMESLLDRVQVDNRYLMLHIKETRLVDKDYHIMFNIEFYDDLIIDKKKEYMNNMQIILKRS